MSAPFRIRVSYDPARVQEGLVELFRDLGATRVHTEWGGWLRFVEAHFADGGPPFPEDSVEALLNLIDPEGTVRLETFAGQQGGPWQEGWRGVYRGADAGEIHIRPPWLPAAEGGVTVRVDPRCGFGGGRHPSTRLALRALAKLFPRLRGARCLDVGCGSGVLSIAAALGGLSVTALEIAPAARQAARRAFELNGVAVRLLETPLEALGERFPLVVANMAAGTLRSIAKGLRESVARGGALVLSGFREDELAELVRLVGLAPEGPPLAHGDGWVCATLLAPG